MSHEVTSNEAAAEMTTAAGTPTTKRDMVYILAPSYTGSTLLTFLLAQHKDIATIGELKATSRGDLSKYHCSCGQLQIECGFWQRVLGEMQRRDPGFSLEEFGTHFRSQSYVCDRVLRAGVRGPFLEAVRELMIACWPGCRSQFDAIMRRNQQLVEVVCELQDASVFLDGSKDPNRLKYLVAAGLWNVKVIYLIRDGRGACNSFMRHYDVPMEVAVKEWRRTHQECDRLVPALGDACKTVHYEKLCLSPDETMADIYSFLGLSDQTHFESEHHVLGNAMRLKGTSEIRLDEKWRKSLSDRDLSIFDKYCAQQNESYGYGK